ncbi:MAG: hypothetical protein NDI94_03635 [Candidatus Woesearchaeota archaeon]|jgi:DNA-directed RNA polymerase subunit RPC12/RpoP|nr:hypothetical protein [Candidatus Woesearchaeota archaeon]
MDKIRYKCMKCKYAFTRKNDLPVTKCPYCGKESVEEQKGMDASKILDESSY